jgi:arginine repressor
VIKTIVGGASIISSIIEERSDVFGILGCIPSESTVLVIPQNIENTYDAYKVFANILM